MSERPMREGERAHAYSDLESSRKLQVHGSGLVGPRYSSLARMQLEKFSKKQNKTFRVISKDKLGPQCLKIYNNNRLILSVQSNQSALDRWQALP